MVNENLNTYCGKNKTDISRNTEKNNACPVCNTIGIKVKNITVKHLIAEEIIEHIGDVDYFLCMNEECEVVYYNSELDKSFVQNQVKVPIWFKKDANPKYVCYCSKVTEEQVISAIVQDGADNMKDVLKITGAMNNSNCLKENPLGKCCHQIVQQAINKGLSMK